MKFIYIMFPFDLEKNNEAGVKDFLFSFFLKKNRHFLITKMKTSIPEEILLNVCSNPDYRLIAVIQLKL